MESYSITTYTLDNSFTCFRTYSNQALMHFNNFDLLYFLIIRSYFYYTAISKVILLRIRNYTYISTEGVIYVASTRP